MTKTLLAILVVLAPLLAQAGDVYIYKDDRGQLHYTDKPVPGAEKARLPELQTYSNNPAGPGQPATAPADNFNDSAPELTPEAAALGFYTGVEITNPTQNQTLHSFETEASANVQPALQSAQGHQLVFYLDGMAMPADAGATSVVLKALNRGTHNLVAAVLDSDGVVLTQSGNVSFNVLPPSRLIKPKQ